jgi:1-acyl-sn-glycerol-3-phosphate acyltransferase
MLSAISRRLAEDFVLADGLGWLHLSSVDMLARTAVFLTRLITGVNPVWVNCERESACTRVYFANHGSHLDFAVLWSALPLIAREKTRPVAAKDYWGRTKLTRAVIGIFNGLLIAREAITRADNPIEQMAAALRAGESLILFPEGTRSKEGCIGEFKSGLYHLASKVPEVELVPVFLQNLNRILPKGHLLPVPLISTVVFGPPLKLTEGERKQDFLARTKKAVTDLMPGACD